MHRWQVLFHDALMKVPSEVREFARTARRPPAEAELSSALLGDGLAGTVNHIWVGLLLGATAGGVGAVFGKHRFLAETYSYAEVIPPGRW
jgi:hypothetical protein